MIRRKTVPWQNTFSRYIGIHSSQLPLPIINDTPIPLSIRLYLLLRRVYDSSRKRCSYVLNNIDSAVGIVTDFLTIRTGDLMGACAWVLIRTSTRIKLTLLNYLASVLTSYLQSITWMQRRCTAQNISQKTIERAIGEWSDGKSSGHPPRNTWAN